MMADPDTDDRSLLVRWQTTADESAFEALAHRHLPFVYRAALRQLTLVDRHMADDVTQAVFLILHHKPKAVMAARSLPAWLHRTTRYAVANAQRIAARRRLHEAVAAAARPEGTMPPDSTSLDENLLPMLDEAIDSLGAADRATVIGRYLQNQDLPTLAVALGTTPEAARKRSERAIEKLRHYLTNSGIATVTVPAILDAFAHASTSRQFQEISVATHAAAGAGTSRGAIAIAKGITTMMVMTKAKLVAAFLIAAVSAVALAPVFAADADDRSRVAALREQLQTSRDQIRSIRFEQIGHYEYAPPVAADTPTGVKSATVRRLVTQAGEKRRVGISSQLTHWDGRVDAESESRYLVSDTAVVYVMGATSPATQYDHRSLASIAPATRAALEGLEELDLMNFGFGIGLTSFGAYLDEQLDMAGTKVELSDDERPEGGVVHVVTVSREGKRVRTITIDPACGHLITKSEMYGPESDDPLRTVRTVVERTPAGIWLPVRGTYTDIRSNATVTLEAKNVRINEELPASVFEVPALGLPEGGNLFRYKLDGSRDLYRIRDGRPVLVASPGSADDLTDLSTRAFAPLVD